jgi:hypothetical protein
MTNLLLVTLILASLAWMPTTPAHAWGYSWPHHCCHYGQ